MACTQKYSLSYTDFFSPHLSLFHLTHFNFFSSSLSSIPFYFQSSLLSFSPMSLPLLSSERAVHRVREVAGSAPPPTRRRPWLREQAMAGTGWAAPGFKISNQNFRNFGSKFSKFRFYWTPLIWYYFGWTFLFFFIFHEFGNIWFKFYSKIHIILIRSFQNFGNSSISATPRTNDQNERLNLKFPKTIRSNF